MDGIIIGGVLAIIAWLGFHRAKIYFEEYKRQNEAINALAEQQDMTDKQHADTIHKQAEIAEQSLMIDRIFKATDSLGKTDNNGNALIVSRISGLQALERIAKDNITHHVEIMRIICAYIRQNSPNRYKTDILDELQYLGEDIKVAINIIAERDKWSDGEERLQQEREQEYYIDLNGCYLCGANLKKAYLTNACFDKTNLCGANFNGADLSDAMFMGSDMISARFSKTNLTNTNFDSANLSGASLHEADFSGIKGLWNVSLTDAWLKKANLSFESYDTLVRIDMSDAETKGAYAKYGNLFCCENLTQKQLDKMFCGIFVRIPANLKRPKHWPTEKLDYTEFKKAYKEWLEKTYPNIDKEIKNEY